jgi:hypothetical protein
MKTIKTGTKKVDTYNGTCRACGCVVEFTRGEAEYRHDPRGSNESLLVVKCPTPCCGNEIYAYVP